MVDELSSFLFLLVVDLTLVVPHVEDAKLLQSSIESFLACVTLINGAVAPVNNYIDVFLLAVRSKIFIEN